MIIAKPVLLAAVADAIGEGEIRNNRIEFSEALENRYGQLMQTCRRESQFAKATGMEYPFWYLAGDGFLKPAVTAKRAIFY